LYLGWCVWERDGMASLTHTISGNIVQIRSPDETSINSLKVYFSPKQSGSGTPSPTNIRAITGWTDFNIYKGKNIIPSIAEYVSGKFISDTGDIGSTSYYMYLKNFIPVQPNTNYTFSFNKVSAASRAVTVPFYNANQEFISRIVAMNNTKETGNLNCSFTTPENTYFIRVSLPDRSENIQLELGTTATSYIETAPIEITLENTYYYGYMDLVAGQLVKTHGYIEYDGSEDENWEDQIFQDNYNFYITAPSDAKVNTTLNDDLICNVSTSSEGSLQNNKIKISKARYFNADIGTALNISSASDFKTWLSEHPMQVVYKLATPETIQLTAQQMKVNQGATSIWSNSNNNVEINYNLHETSEIQAIKHSILVMSADNGYQEVEWLYRNKNNAGPYCRLNWNLVIGDQITTKTLMLDTAKTESAFGASTSPGSVELYYKVTSGDLTTWQSTSNTWIDNTTTTLNIPNELNTTVISPFTFQMWGCYRIGRYPFMGRLYGVTVKNSNNVLIHNLVPCFRKRDNIPGFFDKITKQFYPNAADTGSFELPVYIGGLPVLINNAYFSSSIDGNGKFNNYSENNDWFLTGPFDTGSS
jgi:hypothetical protein